MVDAELMETGDEPVLLYFTTSWCGPCRVFGPQLEAYIEANPGLLRMIRIDAEQSPELAARFRVRAFPTLTLVRAGEQLWLRAGALSEQELADTLPRLIAGARALADDRTGFDTVTQPPEVAPPGSVTVPLFDDPRITVYKGSEKLQPGAGVQLAPGEALRAGFTSDLRLTPSCDLGILQEFPPGAIDSVTLHCSDLTPSQVELLGEVPALAALSLVSSRPLNRNVVASFARLRGLQLLYVDAPDLDLAAIRRRLPDAMVNFDWIAPRLSVHLSDPEPADRPRELPAIRLADPGPEPVIALAEHPADPAPEVLAALARVEACMVAKVCDLADSAVQDEFRFAGRTELLLVLGGSVVARRDACGPHHVDELVALAGETDVAPGTRGRPPSEDRVVTFDLKDSEAWLVPPNAARADWIALKPRQADLQIPAGWSLLVRTAAPGLDALPSDEIDALEVRVSSPAVLEGLKQWPRLDQLTVVMPAPDEAAVVALEQLTDLGRLVVMTHGEADLAARLRRSLPESIVNNEWTHPALIRGAFPEREMSRSR
ncbi:thioredoxin family protein [Nonomuraea angiospora]|uniref:thioredoxin family protein n=1 Tax=Nonomuraea angiospora TaxID=46172 RepID=UPI0033217402